MRSIGWLTFIALLLVPASLGFGLDQELTAPALPETGLDLELDTDQPVPQGAAEVCAVGACLATDGNREAAGGPRGTGTSWSNLDGHEVEAPKKDAGIPVEAVAAGASAAALLGLLAKWWMVGPGRIMSIMIGPLNFMVWGVTSRLHLTPELENPTRARILQYIRDHPGASIQDVRQAMDIAWGTAVYHLQHLERGSQAVSCRDGSRHRYWIEGTAEAGVRRAWMVLEQPTARRIARAVGTNPGIHQGGICERLQMGSPTASKHLKRLVTRGLVEANRCSRYMLYSPTPRLTQAMEVWDSTHDPSSSMASAP